jgi:DEAD/DEAH box helicase domain-containing protein
MKTFLDLLRSFDAIRDNQTDHPDEIHTKSLPFQEPIYDDGTIFNELHPDIRKVLEKIEINNLYQHQAEAIRHSIIGKNVVLESPTASGKTLAFSLSLLNRLLNDINAYALLIYPMKAVANDQRRQLLDILSYYRLESWTFDGDTNEEERRLLKQKPPRILITNPDTLHLSFLGWSDQWENLLNKIQFIVLDEIHEYRGYFGTNFALLFRRFLLKLKKLGCEPQLFLCTATCANSLEHAERLTGKKFTHVKSQNIMKPQRDFIFITPSIPDFKYYDIYKLRIVNASLACMSAGLSTIVFCPSRKFAEDVCKMTKKNTDKYNLNMDEIVPYKSGLNADTRREIEKGLRTGKFKVAFTTNALELGIDIGKLDVCILAGFPDSIMSAWQRIGRVGRSWDKKAFVIFYALNNAFDRFYVSNIDAFLNKPFDQIVIGINNEELISRHIPYLLHESGWSLDESDKEIIGEKFFDIAKKNSNNKRQILINNPNYFRLNIRGDSGSILKLLHNGNEIGSISESQAFREAYLGAIYSHFGNSYRVSQHGGNEIILEDSEPYQFTEPSFYTIVQSTVILDGKRYSEVLSVYYGKLTIFENFTGYKLKDERTGNIIEEVKSEVSHRKQAHTFWLRIEDVAHFKNYQDGINALEHIFRVGAPFIIPIDKHDVSTYSRHNPYEIYLYENYPGGIGISEKVLKVFREIITEGLKIAEKCSCKDGCPRCIFPPRFKKEDGLSKNAGINLAHEILDITENPPEEEFDIDIFGWKKLAEE